MEQMLYIIPRALAIGILISAPMGPIGMLVIQRTLNKGRWPAFFTGIGAAFSDLAYCLITGFGLSFVTDFIDAHQMLIQVLGSVVLGAFGLYLFRKRPKPTFHSAEVTQSNNFVTDTVTGFLLTFSNPLILFFVIGLFARFNLVLPEFRFYHYIVSYSGIFVGALFWWYIVTWLVSTLRSRFNERSLLLINRIIGSVILVMAIMGFVIAIKDHFFSMLIR